MRDLLEVGELIAARAVTAREVTEALLARIAELNGKLHAYTQVLEASALRQAEAADREMGSGLRRGPLHGVPISVKDLCWIEGVPTAGGTSVRKDFRPPEDATVVRRLAGAGAVLIGKTQLTEGAYSDYHPSVTPVRNPWNADYWAGISSSGSAAATAAGLCYGSVASDTGGSIRWPCAANGVTGLKPTWGRVSRHGILELAASLDHIGPIARTALDAGAILAAIAGSDLKDPTAATRIVPDYVSVAAAGVKGLRVGIDPSWNNNGVDIETQTALASAAQIFGDLGAVVVEIEFPAVARIVRDWVPNCAVEAAVAHEADYSTQADQYGTVLASVIETGRAVSGTDYQKILLRRAEFRGRVETVFESVDVLLTPVHPFAPLSLGTIATLGDQPELIAGLQRYTCPFNMSGHPTLAFPGGLTKDALPIGLQLVAAHFAEAALVRAGAAFQAATGWHRLRPVNLPAGREEKISL
ncbi:MAG: amidase [Proteobacteria bacterium]|nr:amidase [Pseudomonadota bacterium]